MTLIRAGLKLAPFFGPPRTEITGFLVRKKRNPEIGKNGTPRPRKNEPGDGKKPDPETRKT